MRIAIPSEDQVNLGQHVGRCSGFVIVEIVDGAEVGREYRANTFTHHALGDHSHTKEPHHHAGVLQALADCDMLVSGGMGRGLHADLNAAGIRACLTDRSTIDDVVAAVMAGELVDMPERACQHDHGHGPGEQLHRLT